MSRGAAFSTEPAGVIRRSSSTMNAGTSIVSGSAILLPADHPDPVVTSDAFGGEDLGERPGAISRLTGQAEVLEQVAPQLQGSRSGHAVALVADQDGRLARRADDEHRLFEARVEAGEVGEVRAVLAVRVHDDLVVPLLVRTGPELLEAVAIDVRPGSRASHRTSRSPGAGSPRAAPWSSRLLRPVSPAGSRAVVPSLRVRSSRIGWRSTRATVPSHRPAIEREPRLRPRRPIRSGSSRARRWRVRHRRSAPARSSGRRYGPRSRIRSRHDWDPVVRAAPRSNRPSPTAARRLPIRRSGTG